MCLLTPISEQPACSLLYMVAIVLVMLKKPLIMAYMIMSNIVTCGYGLCKYMGHRIVRKYLNNEDAGDKSGTNEK